MIRRLCVALAVALAFTTAAQAKGRNSGHPPEKSPDDFDPKPQEKPAKKKAPPSKKVVKPKAKPAKSKVKGSKTKSHHATEKIELVHPDDLPGRN